jgi:type II secretory pathway pseudopilin PulG
MNRLLIRGLMFAIRFRPSPEMIVLGLCGLLLLAVAVPALVQTRERARNQTAQDQLKRLGVGMQSYHDTFLSYPSSPATKRHVPDAEPKNSSQLISPL